MLAEMLDYGECVVSGHDAAEVVIEDWEDVVALFDLGCAWDRPSPFEVVTTPNPHVVVWVPFWGFLLRWEGEAR